MTQQDVTTYLQQYGSYFPEGKLFELQDTLTKRNDLSVTDLMSIELKDPKKATLFAYLVGVFGVDRFWLQQKTSGTIKLMITVCYCLSFLLMYFIDWLGGLVFLCTMLAVVIWWIIDIATASKRARAMNYTTLMTYLTH